MVEAPLLSPARKSKPRNTAIVPLGGGLSQIAAEAGACRRCALWQAATQTVCGEGPPDARLMLVGEQPGDQEDLAGRPFVGPAGQMLDRALAAAGIDRARAYVTNAVKHFKFEPRGKRRIHQNPDAGEIAACRFWLDQERALLRPAVTVLLGASAARAVLGRAVTISRERGQPIPLDDGVALVTVHPSYLLRLPDVTARDAEYARFVADLRKAGGFAPLCLLDVRECLRCGAGSPPSPAMRSPGRNPLEGVRGRARPRSRFLSTRTVAWGLDPAQARPGVQHGTLRLDWHRRQ
jgi:DNA polymerase